MVHLRGSTIPSPLLSWKGCSLFSSPGNYIDCSFEQPFRSVYELVGSRGVIEVPDAYLPPAMSRALARLRMIGSGSDADSGADLIKDLNFDPMNQYSAMVDAFADSVARGHLVEPAEDGLAQMTVLDEMLASARS